MTSVIDQMHTDTHTHTHNFKFSSLKWMWLLFKTRCSETPVSRWYVMVDGWWMLSPCGVPAGVERRRRGGEREQELSRVEFRKCETAEAKCQSWELWTDGRPCTWWCACFVPVWWVWMSEGRSVIPPCYR